MLDKRRLIESLHGALQANFHLHPRLGAFDARVCAKAAESAELMAARIASEATMRIHVEGAIFEELALSVDVCTLAALIEVARLLWACACKADDFCARQLRRQR